MELAGVRERSRVADVKQQLPFHRAIRNNACGHALTQALAHQVTAIGESLERVVGVAIHSQAQERIEAVQDVPQRPCELSPGVIYAPREIARSVSAGSAISVPRYSGNLE